MRYVIFISGLLTVAFLNACQKDQTAVAADVDCSAVTYSGTIQPLVQQHCSGSSCHSSNGREVNLMTYNQLKVYVNNGEIRRQVLDNQTMPEDSQLSSTQLGQIKCWLDNGALNN